MNDINQGNTIQLPDMLDPDSTGVQAFTTPDAMIEIATDAGDDARSFITPADARRLADWLKSAADLCDVEIAKFPALKKAHS